MGYMRGTCAELCVKDPGNCWHKPTSKIRKQLRTGGWLVENSKGYVRLVDFTEMVFESGEYEKFRNPNIFADVAEYERINKHVLQTVSMPVLHKNGKSKKKEVANKELNLLELIDHWSDEDHVWHTKDHTPVVRNYVN